MSAIELLVERKRPLSTSEAKHYLLGTAGALTELSPARKLWVNQGFKLVELTDAAFDAIFTAASYVGAGAVGAPSHVLDMFATSTEDARIGVVCLNVEARFEPESFPGFRLSAELDDEFDVGADQALRLIDRILAALDADVAVIGPSRSGGAAGRWATYVRRSAPATLPPEARVVPVRGGVVIVAHDGHPSEDSERARRAMKEVADAIAARPRVDFLGSASEAADGATSDGAVRPTSEAPESWLDGTRELARDAAFAPALPFAGEGSRDAVPDAVGVTDDGLGETSEVHAEVALRPALPFAGDRPSEPPPVAPRPPASPRRFSPETEDVDTARLRSALLPFAGPASPAKNMPLERYARLRASLALNGEANISTWAEFGIRSLEEKDALQRRFAALFRNDPEAQARFVALVRQHTAESGKRASASGSEAAGHDTVTSDRGWSSTAPMPESFSRKKEP